MKKKHKQIMLGSVFAVAAGVGLHQATQPIEWKTHIPASGDYSDSKPTLYIDEMERRRKAHPYYHEPYEWKVEEICKYWPSNRKCVDFRKKQAAGTLKP